MQAPLQPRKASEHHSSRSRERSQSREREPSPGRGREREQTLLDTKVDIDLENFTLGGGALQDPRSATPARQQMIWDDMQEQHNQARRRSSVASRASRMGGSVGRRGTGALGKGLSNLEILKQLAALNE